MTGESIGDPAVSHLGPELELLVLMSRRSVDPDRGSRARTLVAEHSDRFDWGRFLDAATRQYVAPLVGRNLARAGVFVVEGELGRHAVPTPVQHQLWSTYQANRSRNWSFLKELDSILFELDELRDRVIVRKGLPLAIRAFGDIGARYTKDIDLLVRPDDVKPIAGVLQEVGYVVGGLSANGRTVVELPDTARRILPLTGKRPPLVRVSGDPLLPAITVGLATSCGAGGSKGPAGLDELFDAAETMVLGGSYGRILGPIDFFIDLCCHFATDARSKTAVAWSRDVTLARCREIAELAADLTHRRSWSALAEVAARRSTVEPISFALHWAEALYPGALDDADARDAFGARPDLHSFGQTDGSPATWQERDLATRLLCVDRRFELDELPPLTAAWGRPQSGTDHE